MTEIESLFEKLEKFPYPETMKLVKGEIKGRAFFPAGKGTFDNDDMISDKRIMILGQDFDSEASFKLSLESGQEDIIKNPTWRNLMTLLKKANIAPNDCFYTNAIMGVRVDVKSTGKSPAFKDFEFIKNCQILFLKQIELQRPKAIFILGKYTAEFLSSMCDSLEDWAKIKNFKTVDSKKQQIHKKITFKNGISSNLILLTHPSFRPSNVGRRNYNGHIGDKAELEMIKDSFTS